MTKSFREEASLDSEKESLLVAAGKVGGLDNAGAGDAFGIVRMEYTDKNDEKDKG